MRREVEVSVIIPTFNRMSFLYSTLICLMHQNVNGFFYEIVIIDSGTDETERMVESLRIHASTLIVYKKIKRCKNRSKLRSIGAKISSGETLIFLDCDMLVPPNFINTHYSRHINRDNLVLLGKRKSLIEFDIQKFSEITLAEHFDVLETMPCYEDVREQYFKDKTIELENVHNPWRFLFSHSFSVKKHAYFSIGGFSDAFGEQWGYEDIELGFRLHKAGYKFEIENSISSYHQPHFEQSLTEQQGSVPNKSLFVESHTCFEVELLVEFYDSFDRLYPVLRQIAINKFTYPRVGDLRYFDIILGCLFSVNNNASHKKMFFGVHVPEKYKKLNQRLLVLNTFFFFPAEIQMSILHEAFELSRKLWFQKSKKIDDDNICLRIICDMLGYEVFIEETEDYFIVEIEKQIYPRLLTIYLPEVFSPQKRYLCLFIADKLLKMGWQINLRDTRDSNAFDVDDFRHNQKKVTKLNGYIKRNFGRCPSMTFGLFDSHITGSIVFKNAVSTILLDDLEYMPLHIGRKLNGLERCVFANASAYNLLSFLSMYEVVNDAAFVCTSMQARYTFCCFMENGFYEDGIDLILEAFALSLKEQSDSTLVIKMPNYGELLDSIHPLHNGPSRYVKGFAIRKKKY